MFLMGCTDQTQYINSTLIRTIDPGLVLVHEDMNMQSGGKLSTTFVI